MSAMKVKDEEGEDPYTRLDEWLKTHPGYVNNLICRDVPGSGRGLFASRDMKPGEIILEIPSTALQNPLTLAPLSHQSLIPAHLFPKSLASRPSNSRNSSSGSSSIPTKKSKPNTTRTNSNTNGSKSKDSPIVNPSTPVASKLDTTQLLTLFLTLTRVSGTIGKEYSEGYEVYLGSLPRSFRPWHPLTWRINSGNSETSILNGKKTGESESKKKEEEEEDLECLENHEDFYGQLNDLIPYGATAKLDDVEKRYRADITRLKDVLISEDTFSSQNLIDKIPEDDWLWAWLNVNTRTVSIPLNLPSTSPNETYNHTLVPLLDMINHNSHPSIPKPLQVISPTSKSLKRTYSSALLYDIASPGKIGFRLIAPLSKGAQGDQGARLSRVGKGQDGNEEEITLKKGEEVTFEYGGHSNSLLFAEYGFIERPPISIPIRRTSPRSNSLSKETKIIEDSNGDASVAATAEDDYSGWLRTKYGELDIALLVEKLIKTLRAEEGDELVEQKIELLRHLGYINRYTIHTFPSPAHPCYSLVMSLRILHLSSSDLAAKMSPLKSFAITYISPKNASLVKTCLEGMLQEILSENREKMRRWTEMTSSLISEHRSHGDIESATEERRDGSVSQNVVDPAAEGAAAMVRGLLEEEMAIAEKVLERIEINDMDW